MDRRIQRWKIAPELLQRFLLVFVLFLFFSLSIYILFIHSEMDIYSFNSPIFRTDSLTWDIYLEDQLIEKNVSLPYRVKARTGQNIRIETTLSDHVDKSFNCYLIKSNFSSIRILVDGKEISRYPKQRNYPAFLLGCENDFLGFFDQPLNGSRIAVEYHFGSALALNGTKIHPVRIGSFTEIRNLQLNDFFDIYMNFSFYSITITGIVLVFIFVKDNRYKRILSCFALLSLLMMLISIMDNPVISLFLQNQLVVSLILMFSYVLFPFAILLFHLATGHHSNMKNQLISLLSIIPIILFIMFCIALTEEAYTSSLIADLTIFSSVTSAMIISIVAILSRDSEQSHLFQDITIALSTFFIMIRGLLLFIVDLSNNEHLLLSIVTYVPFLISALYGASDYMKMERSYMR
ncbi:MAG: hypothetical protein K6G51_03940, partial [Sphaerochaetaceae bacterium]|nr:hypothetical protein [Sphaerochaetaceae bacterium]